MGQEGDLQRMGFGVRLTWAQIWNLTLFIYGILGTGLCLSKPQFSHL